MADTRQARIDRIAALPRFISMSQHTELWKTLRLIVILAAIITVGWFGFRMVEKALAGTAGGLHRGLDKVLAALTHSDTRIVAGRAEVVSKHEIQELALVELRMNATRDYANEGFFLKYLPAGTKRIIVRGEYRVTAGYRLENGTSLRIENGVPVATFPEADVLAVELIDFQILDEKDGWANSITAEDRATILRELRMQMRAEAKRSGILDVVEASMRTRLRDLLGVEEVRIEKAKPTAAE